MHFVAYFVRFQQCKKFENWLTFDKVTESFKMGTFFETQCSCTQIRHLLALCAFIKFTYLLTYCWMIVFVNAC